MLKELKNIKDLTLSKGFVLVDFYADWCGPCKVLAPTLEKFSETKQYEKIKFYKVDIEKEVSLAQSFQVTSLPTIVLFQDGQEVARKTGSMSSGSLNNFLLMALD